jgi:hypothetical protein
MSVGIRTYPKSEREKVVGRRLANSGHSDQRGLGYWAARDASAQMLRGLGQSRSETGA